MSPEFMFRERAVNHFTKRDGSVDAFIMCSKCEEWLLVLEYGWYWEPDEERIYCTNCWVERHETRGTKDLGAG